jgi:hypothetical protein
MKAGQTFFHSGWWQTKKAKPKPSQAIAKQFEMCGTIELGLCCIAFRD